MDNNIEIRECETLDELAACVDLQREVFALPEIEISPVRHLIVTKNAGGFILGAFAEGELVGFVLSVPAFLRGERAFYSHMTAVKKDFQSRGVGAGLKWAQRDRALVAGVKYIKWTFEPWKARNAFFNLEKLGATVREYQANFYGVDYATSNQIGLASDRLFAEWALESDKVKRLAEGGTLVENRAPARTVEIMPDWYVLVKADANKALREQERIRVEFESAFSEGLACEGFERDNASPRYLLFA
ncbi:MAG TPA: GNAT family N-acetyltransferase [Pyrinomonadaceae bacterium]|jgi:predicted GNAT superfamily acetyltransferase|nr:GNAT family N-acetyltransferase [Pyrinomonadaceae bacterium]